MQFSRHVQYRSEKFGAVVFDTLNEKVYVTNETGNDILGLIQDGLDTGTIAERLEEKYAGDAGRISAEVAAFVQDLRTVGLLAPGKEGGA